MGATGSRDQDATLNLAVPKYTSFVGRRVLDPSATRCSVCSSLFLPLVRKKHYCRRCASIICEDCSSMRHYKARDGGWLFRVCRACNQKPCIFDLLQPGERAWRLIMEYAGELCQNRILQMCRRSQMGYHLQYRWGTWDELFTEQTFLAKGANGAVFRTTLRPHIAREFDTPAARGPVAVKVIQKNTIYSVRKWSHIERELHTLRLCKNPHVIELIGVFQSPEAVFIILEYAMGGDLFDWLVARRKPKEAEVRAIAVQLLGTVFLMHEKFGVVHRDIKPENVLLRSRCRGSEEPHLKFADFGFARRYPVKGNSGGQLTSSALLAAVSGSAASASLLGGVKIAGYIDSGLVGSLGGSFDVNNLLLNATPCGTLGFAPPEVIQAYNARKADPAANEAAPPTAIDVLKKMDIFALGVTLSILLTGQEPFPVTSSRAHMEAVQRGPAFNSRQWQLVSPAAKNLIRKMLAAKVQDRPHALECLRSEWFEGTAANDFLAQGRPQQHVLPHMTMQVPEVEVEEDVRTFQKSVRSLRHRPDMIYSQNRDGTIGAKSRTVAIAEEEEHVAATAGAGDGPLTEQQALGNLADAAEAVVNSASATGANAAASASAAAMPSAAAAAAASSGNDDFVGTPSMRVALVSSASATPIGSLRRAGSGGGNSEGGAGAFSSAGPASKRVAFSQVQSSGPINSMNGGGGNSAQKLPPLAPTIMKTSGPLASGGGVSSDGEELHAPLNPAMQ